MKKLCRKFSFDVPNDATIIFAIRGSFPLQVQQNKMLHAGFPEKEKYVIRKKVDYKDAACTIGIWNLVSGKISLFPASTVPSLEYLHQNRGAEKYFNILYPGKYRFIKGIHPRSKTRFQRHEALLMPGEGWIMKPGLIRKSGRTGFDFTDVKYDVVYPGDNLHASRWEPESEEALAGDCTSVKRSFSSSGCLTVAGQPKEYVRSNYTRFWNSWEQFIQCFQSSPAGTDYSLLLFNYSDLVNIEEPVQRNILRYGSQNAMVTELQKQLSEIHNGNYNRAYYTGKHDGVMQAETVKAYIRFMYDFSPGKISGEADFYTFNSLTRHFIFKFNQYQHVIN